MQNLLVPIGIMVTLAVLGWLTQMLKNAQLKQEAERERQRREALPAARATRNNNNNQPAKEPTSDIDRFLAEIDRLRQKGGAPAAPAQQQKPQQKPKPKPVAVPTVPVKKQRLSESPTPAPFVTTAAPPAVRTSAGTPLISEELPVATVVATKASAPAGASRPKAAPKEVHNTNVTHTVVPTTPFGEQLMALLATPQALPVAVVLTEILGEPKCRKKY